ncbi:hypothetical protein [Pseudolactococcus carnosus]|nr:hypothetical protein [Lactococcus carnosus]
MCDYPLIKIYLMQKACLDNCTGKSKQLLLSQVLYFLLTDGLKKS